MSDNSQIINLSFLTLSQKYLHTAKNILEQMINNGNLWMPVFNSKEFDNETEMWKKYFEVTKWSDFQIIIPTLFLFFHGLELLNKCLLFLANKKYIENLDLNHNLENLYKKLKENYKDNFELLNTFKKYSYLNQNTPTIIKNFIKENEEIKSIQDFYQSLRYPTSKNKHPIYNYISMKYKEKESLPFAQELKNDIDILLIQSTKIYKVYRKK